MSMALIAGKTAFLPMDPYEMETFLYDLGLDGPCAEHHFELVDGFYDDYRIDWGTDFRLANRLTQRVSDMGDRREDFRAWCCAQGHCSVEDALRTSYNMRSITFFPGMDSDEALGEFALDNNFFEDYNALPTEIYEALDQEKVGARMREQEGGRFVEGGYLVLFEDFTQEPIPEEPLAYFQVRFNDEQRDSGWCNVPLTEADERFISRIFDSEDLSGLPLECRSIIPQLNGIISDVYYLPGLRQFDEKLINMSGEDIQKYKVLLEVSKPDSIGRAFRFVDALAHYDVDLEYADAAAYARQYLDERYHVDEHDPLLRFTDFEGLGADMLHDDGYLSTRYGTVYENVMAQSLLQGPNAVYSGPYYCDCTEGYPTCICWDPDAQKVWLELGFSVCYDPPDGDFSYYQQFCEGWGVRHCASQEEYYQIIDDMGDRSYDKVMAEAEDQGFGGMGGMS